MTYYKNFYQLKVEIKSVTLLGILFAKENDLILDYVAAVN
jgi:hypothetical protein